MFPYDTICWKQSVSSPLTPQEQFKLLTSEDEAKSKNHESLCVAAVVAEFIRVFDGPGRDARLTGNIVSWHCAGAIHQVEITQKYFRYGYDVDPTSTGLTMGASFESCRLPAIAGKFGCVVYYPDSDIVLSRPEGSAVTTAITLRSDQAVDPTKSKTAEPALLQLPLLSLANSQQVALIDTCAILEIDPLELESKTNLVLEDGLDGLDFYRAALLQLGAQLYGLQSRPHRQNNLEVLLPAGTPDAGSSLDKLLLALGLTSKNITWMSDSVKFSPWELWRQDDNGNQFLVEKCTCRADAFAREKVFTQRGHKQVYWTRQSVA